MMYLIHFYLKLTTLNDSLGPNNLHLDWAVTSYYRWHQKLLDIIVDGGLIGLDTS